MAAEFTLSFLDGDWYSKNKDAICEKISSLDTFFISNDNEYRLLGKEAESKIDCWLYDVRLFLEELNIFIEISARPISIDNDLSLLFNWLRNQTEIVIHDDDGVKSNW